ncbi:RAD protein (Pv-fam-e) [Plasmodium vivax]|uniref:RAD protein (Pv-fam-e) n=5 Tax=Plasmodium vivax TaxID=5855 RepID=A5K5Z7_PLAVS|nr:RAD protein (Pv-fam-e) [Plasmodium vivax]KMZ81921.1 RAD protein (Pv-fam-e) [Plasmodium vivax India VII]KMZ88207.1 RAD protein (Pv-fam-e) [Plasmodium vivax Brazil I]KNA01121.1 RAD protein (Pv-fam-e) [Plasmodium vivax North Korean]EDL45332.1 RAD protein (Pv-fam-e) [Plasmodium vivax]CAI7718924.1 Plasmodium exported protein (PHIST), unknown function [Plasmodium vivax]|eukprot:XP_001615059.1 RAD protein (Pv-fam-e) [Plasmodium vivax Sal-1]
MARTHTWQRILIRGGFTTALFLLWIGILSVRNCKYEGQTLEELQMSCCPRSLSAASYYYDSASAQANQAYYENNNHVFYTKKYEDFLSTMDDMQLSNKVLTREEMNSLLDSLSLFVSKKKTRLVFFHYNNYLKKLYNDTMDLLWKDFATLAMRRGIPHDDQLMFWKKCDDEITDSLIAKDEFFLEQFEIFLSKGKVMNINFFKFLGNYSRSWKETLKRFEVKWSKILRDNVESYPRW